MANLPKTMRALKSVDAGKAEIQEVALPTVRPTYILVKTLAVALNPTDWKHIDFMPANGATVGCDITGEVVEVGSEVTKKFTKGQKVTGVIHGVNKLEPEDGAFAEYAVLKGDLAIPLPSSLSPQEAATLGIGISTVGQGLYQSLKLPLPSPDASGTPSKDGPWLLVYGGSTATGTLAVQYGKLSGYRVISTNSPRNNKLLESLGAEKCFDYNDKDCGGEIRKYTNDELKVVFDCISEGDSPKISGEALSSKGGKISFLLPVEQSKTGRGDEVETARTLAYSIMGEKMDFRGSEVPAKAEDFEFGKKFWDLSGQLLSNGKLKVHPPEVRDGGLDKVHEGLRDLKEGKVSGKKIVYTVA